eukprot:Clim_evm54s33 gene=Clim_evmTU54s33
MTMEGQKVLRIGSRKSQLAMIQTHQVRDMLQKAHGDDITIEIKTMETIGDKILDRALSRIGEKSLFTKELEIALEQKAVDLVVHSLKDLPTTLPENMTVGAITEREDPADVMILAKRHIGKYKTIHDLPAGSTIGSSSVRRVAQLRLLRPDVTFTDVRGNLNTRLAKLDKEDDPQYDALILAKAGVLRMGWSERISQDFNGDQCLHAVGQGALGIETRADDLTTLEAVKVLECQETALRCHAERAFMRTLEGGCSVPVAVNSALEKGAGSFELTLTGGVFSIDGKKSVRHTVTGTVASRADAEQCGEKLAQDMIGMGAADILAEIRQAEQQPTDPRTAPGTKPGSSS